MQLLDINPERYRHRLNKIIFACIGALTLGSLGISQLLIRLFPSASGTHFHWNLIGVIISVIIVLYALSKFKTHPFFYEVTYIWDLKQVLNRINRRIKKIQLASEQGDAIAINILYFNYAGSRQLWQLDNNIITINHLTSLEEKLALLADQHHVELDLTAYHNDQLAEY